MKKVDLDLYFNEGISYAGGLLDAAVKYDIIEKTGSWFSFQVALSSLSMGI